MIMRSLQPKFARHLIGFPHTNFGSLGKKPSEGERSRDVGAISSAEMRPPRVYQTIGKTFGFYYPPSPQTSYIIPSTPSPIDYYSFYTEVDTIVLPARYIGPTTFSTLFQVLRIPTSFNLLLGRPWIHKVEAIPSFLHQKVKFIHDGWVIMVQYTRDMFAYSEPVPQVSHNEDDLFLTTMSFDQHNNTMVLDMMRGISFLPSMGLGLCQQGPSEFIVIDHDTTFGLGMSLVDYFVKGSKIRPRIEEIESVVHTDTEIELQHLFHQLQLSDGVLGTSVSMEITLPSPNRASLLSLCFPEEVIDDGMDMMTVSQITNIIKLQLVSPFDMFGVSTIKRLFYHDSNPINERVSLAIGDAEAVDFGTEDQPKELRIGSLLSTYESDRLIHLLRRLHPCWSLQVKEEIQKQLSVGFILVVEYLEWLANVIPVPKKDGKVRVCVDFEDLNKSSPKDDFSLPHIDLLVDRTTGHSMLSFMNGFLGVMSFGLKNIRATYQRAATTLFHDMMHRDVEVYVDDMIRFFERIQKFRLRLNPNKCTFGVTSGKLLGHMVNERGIEVEPDKIKAILDMLVSRTKKEIRGFLSRLQYINRFIARLTNILPPLPGHPLLLYFSVSDMALGCMLAPLDDSRNERLGHYMTEYSVHLLSRLDPLRYLINRPTLTGRLMRWLSRYGIGVLLVSPQGDHISRSIRLAFFDQHPITNNIVEYEACILGLETALKLGIRQMKLLVERFDYLRYVHLPRAQNQFFDALATLASFVDIPIDVVIHPLLNELRPTPAYYCLIGETELYALTLPWPFLVWGINVIRKISPKSSNGHEFILIAIDYFTKWVEFASYARVPHELISDRGVHFRAEIDTLLQRYNI
ncbi:hypothetical protein AAG906_018861 [Vitis piasezkii]